MIAKIEEEVAELREPPRTKAATGPRKRWATCSSRSRNLARKLGIDAESALRKANDKFTKRFSALEEIFEAPGPVTVHDATLDEMEEVWQQVKREPNSAR